MVPKLDLALNNQLRRPIWKQHYFDLIKDLIDKYQADLLYTDGDIFFEEYGLWVNISAATAICC